jgi:TolA-binding protein
LTGFRKTEHIKQLKDFSPDGQIMPAMTYGLMGDAYSEKGDMDNALTYYKKALGSNANDMSTPYYLLKAGLLCEQMKKPEDAKKYYSQIKEKYPESPQGKEIDRYLVGVGGLN